MSISLGPNRPSRRAVALAATRAELIAVARAHFGASGFAVAEVGLIAAQAGVTTGAIYHHFGSKQGLFVAVAETIEAELLAVAASAVGPDPWTQLRTALHALIDFCVAPDIRRILLIEAPQVIGLAAWREIELRYAYGATRATLAALMDAETIVRAPVDFVARTLLALLGEAATEIAAADGDGMRRAQVFGALDRMVDALAITTANSISDVSR